MQKTDIGVVVLLVDSPYVLELSSQWDEKRREDLSPWMECEERFEGLHTSRRHPSKRLTVFSIDLFNWRCHHLINSINPAIMEGSEKFLPVSFAQRQVPLDWSELTKPSLSAVYLIPWQPSSLGFGGKKPENKQKDTEKPLSQAKNSKKQIFDFHPNPLWQTWFRRSFFEEWSFTTTNRLVFSSPQGHKSARSKSLAFPSAQYTQPRDSLTSLSLKKV